MDRIFKHVAHPSREKVCAAQRNRDTENQREMELIRLGVEKAEERGRREKRYEVDIASARHTESTHSTNLFGLG